MGLAAVAGLLIPHIPGLINLVEGIFSKPKSGVSKKDAVVQAVRVIVEKAATTDGQPSANISDDELSGLVESIFHQVKDNITKEPKLDKLYILKGSLQEINTVNV